MDLASAQTGPVSALARLPGRGELTAFLMGLAASVEADAYLLMQVLREGTQASARVIAADWTHDAIALAGPALLASVATSPLAAAPGHRARPLLCAEAPDLPGPLGGEETRLLAALGHAEIYALCVPVGRLRLHLLLSAEMPGAIDATALPGAQMRACYGLSRIPAVLGAPSEDAPLARRERECLSWVSAGKTTDDISMILGVSANTVNSYVTGAVKKLGAANRSSAVACAIRSGII